MLTRIEFTEGSTSTRSFSFRDIVSGFRRTSLDPLRGGRYESVGLKVEHGYMRSPDLNLRFVVPLDDLGGGKKIIAYLQTRGQR